jgi:hypothetical protein
MDVESKALRFVGIHVSKRRVDVHVGCAMDRDALSTSLALLAPLSPRRGCRRHGSHIGDPSASLRPLAFKTVVPLQSFG